MKGVSVSLGRLVAAREDVRRCGLRLRGSSLATRAGGHLSALRGRGVEYDESRAYVPGDDPRTMDWRLTARTDRPHIKVFREERERPIYLLVDQGPSMRFGTRVAFKSVIAAKAAALLGWAAADAGDRVGGLVYDEAGSFLHAAAARSAGLMPLLRALARPQARSDVGISNLTDAAPRLIRRMQRGGITFIISDFAGAEMEQWHWLGRLGERCEPVLLLVYDAMEVNAPPPGRYPVIDANGRRLLDTRTEARRALYEAEFQRRMDSLVQLSRRHGTHLMALGTHQSICRTLAQGLGLRPGQTQALLGRTAEQTETPPPSRPSRNRT